MPALDQWERQLRPYFNRPLHMIGEIPISYAEMEDMASGIRACIQRWGLAQATEILDRQYPFTFLVFLTAFGAYNTERGYWVALGEEMGVPREYLSNHQWHKRYIEKVKKLGLRYFDEEETSTQYVTTIRYHGGIPVYSLGDFFRHFVMPSIEHPDLTGLPAKKALEVLLRNAQHVDAPVIHFLKNSGELGIEFFETCCRMARYFRKHGEIPQPQNINLPERVVRAFENFVEEELQSSEDRAKLRLQKPVLLFTPDPSSPAHLYLRLPEQELPLRYAEGVLEWRIHLAGSQRVIRRPCKTMMRRQGMVVTEDYLPINEVPQAVLVTLVYGADNREEQVSRRWTLPLMAGSRSDQILAFRANGVALRPGDPLPAEEVLLVYPENVELRAEGSARISYYLGSLSGAWRGWQANGWDLSRAWSVQMVRQGMPVGTPLPVAGKLPAPQLLGQPTQWNDDPMGVPLFVGKPPVLRVPIRTESDLSRVLARWRLSLRSSWSAQPEIQKDCSLVQLQHVITVQNGWAELPLSHFLGSSPVGTYTLTLSRPYEEDVEFRFRMWQNLTVLGLKPAIFLTSEGSESRKITLLLPGRASCELQSGAKGISIEPGDNGWEVTVEPETVRADLELVLKKSENENIRVPIFIPIPRLRWALTLDQDQGQLEWTSRLIRRPLEQILQSKNAALHVTMHGLEKAHCLELELVDAESGAVRQKETFKRTPFAADWLRLSFDRLVDTLRHIENQARLNLVYQSSPQEKKIRVPLLLLSHQLEVYDVALHPEGELRWRLTWKQRYFVRNRRVLIQPAWQPWQEAWEFPIPDAQANTLILSDVGLIPTRYCLHFYTAEKDAPPLKAIPAEAAAICIDTCKPEERLAELRKQAREALNRGVHETAFRAVWESACIFHDLGQHQLRDEKLSELTKLILHIENLPLLLGFFRWLEKHNIQSAYNSFFRKRMFNPDFVGKILKRYPKNHPDLRTYLSYVPKVRDIYTESAYLIARCTDQPEVLRACFERLLQQEDQSLIPFIVEMVESARLSNADAADLLGKKPDWALNFVVELPPSKTVNRLLADLLVKASDEAVNALITNNPEPIFRALPYLNKSPKRNRWVHSLIQQSPEEVITTLLQSDYEMLFDMDETISFLSLVPAISIKILRVLPETRNHKALLDRLIERFPSVSGLIRPGSQLKTPFGVARVTKIETLDGKSLELARMEGEEIRVHLIIGEGSLSEKAVLDCAHQELSFVDARVLYTCGHCDFTYPNRKMIDQHHHECHRYQSLFIRTSYDTQIQIDLREFKPV